MATKVGMKGQVVIEQRIRQALGVQPGALAIQRLVGDHVEIQFVAAPHRESVFGILRPHVRHWPDDPDDPDPVADAWAADWAEQEQRAGKSTGA